MGVQPDSAVQVIRKISEDETGERLAWEFGLQARVWVSRLCGDLPRSSGRDQWPQAELKWGSWADGHWWEEAPEAF